MPNILDPKIEHLLRRAGFGARQDELDLYRAESFQGALTRLLEYERLPDTVDSHIGHDIEGYVQTSNVPAFQPNSVITDARQRWLFRMVHTDRPLQEKMALFWHNHFATGYSKLAGLVGTTEATRYMAAKPTEDPGQVVGQLELFRQYALGNFRDLLVAVAKDTAMLFWLDGYTNTKTRPQENFGREIMELFTMGVGHYTEPDVYAAARVFSGWNLARPGSAADGSQHYQFVYVPAQHDTAEKTFSFAISGNGNKTIPARAAADGMQDGLDFIAALAANPETPRYLGKKLYRFFVSETGDVPESFLSNLSDVYFRSGYDMKAVLRAIFESPEFGDRANIFTRFGWPVEFVVRSLKDIGWVGFNLSTALTPLSNMGQNLFDPPDVAGWDLGRSWFSTGSMLARMNFASQLVTNQDTKLAAAAKGASASPEVLMAFVLDALKTPALDPTVTDALLSYLRATGPWTGSAAQLQAKVRGLVHLVAGTPEYQFV
jgi:uncharacterized protein (DUF1800 family)